MPDTAVAPPSLVPLGCGACGSSVPIGPGALARCEACESEVPVPESYLALRAGAELDDTARARADVISKELTRPPSLLLRSWMTAGSIGLGLAIVLLGVWLLVSLVMCVGAFVDAGFPGALIMLLVGLVLGVPLLYNEALHALAPGVGVDLADVWGGAGSYAVLGLAFYLLLTVPHALAAYADGFESARAALRRVLTASARTPGGAATCRACGALVHVPEGAVHVRCMYCRADSLIDGSGAFLAEAEENTKQVCRDLESALQQERSAAAAGRRLAAMRLSKGLVLVPVCVLLGRGVAGVNDDGATFWHRAVRSSPMLPGIAENPPLPRGEVTLLAVHRTCHEDDCWAYYFVALERGDQLRVAAQVGALRHVELARRHVGPWYDPTYEWKPMDDGVPAPYTGWYRVKLGIWRQGSGPNPRPNPGTTPRPDPHVTWDAAR